MRVRNKMRRCVTQYRLLTLAGSGIHEALTLFVGRQDESMQKTLHSIIWFQNMISGICLK
jgi:hypothetical protein